MLQNTGGSQPGCIDIRIPVNRDRATPYRSAAGEVLGTVGALSCIDRQKSLERENEYLRDELRDVTGPEELIGPSMGLGRIRNQIEMVAPTEASVLISGESGIIRSPVFALFFSKHMPFLFVAVWGIRRKARTT